MKLVILGAPGAGKGTQAEKIASYYNMPHISTGNIFRDNIKNKTDLGLKISEIVNRGELVPDSLTNELVRLTLLKKENENSFILDGFPRTLDQAKVLDEYEINIDYAIYIKIEKDSIIKRISGRLVCSKCSESFHKLYNPAIIPDICDKCGGELIQRKDDNEETVSKRLDIFNLEASPIIDFYKSKNILLELNGEGEVDNITNNIIKLLGSN